MTTPMQIRGTEHPIKDVFSDRYRFEIPPYQRAYAWTTAEVDELLDDLMVALDESDSDVAPDPYFLGSIVLAKTEHQQHAEVIDGQQRLTTLTILLSALAQRVKNGTKLWKYVLQEGDEFAGNDEIPRLALRPRDAGFFRQYVQTPGGLKRLPNLATSRLNDACRNVRDNAIFIRKWLAEQPDQRVKVLGQYLLQHCYIIVVSTPSRDSAFRIFAVLNDRGLDLTPADIIKNELIGSITDRSEQDAYTKKWEDAEDSLGRDLFAELFSHIRMIYAKNKLRTTLLRAFRTAVLDRLGDPKTVIDDVVSPYSEILADLTNENLRSATEYAEEINTLIGWLQRLDNFDWIPPALRYLHDHEPDDNRVLQFLRRLDRLAASMFLRRVGINARIERYGQVLQELDGGVDVLQPGSALDLTAEECRETTDVLDGPVYSVTKTRQFVLLRLDAVLSAGGATYDYKTVTVEHVLPQNPPKMSQWRQWFTDEEREKWVSQLANLVLLDRRKNSAASNYEFERKKDTYFRTQNLTSPFALTTQVLVTSEWTPQLLARRQQALVGRLVDLWELRRDASA